MSSTIEDLLLSNQLLRPSDRCSRMRVGAVVMSWFGNMERAPRWLWLLSLAFLVLAFSGLLGLDALLARSLDRSPSLDRVVQILEVLSLKSVSEFLLPSMLLLGGGLLWLLGRTPQARALIYIGFVPLIAYFTSDLSKPLFGRLRPFEAMDRGLADSWFASGNSFPSGHTAFFAGLIVPIVVVHRGAWPLLTIPLLVAAQRVLAADHYLSDVSLSFALALGAAALLLPVLGRGPSPERLSGETEETG
jgi:membrane-associated phospholipid phosphatase